MENNDMRVEYIKKGRERQRAVQQKQEADLLALSNYIISFIKE